MKWLWLILGIFLGIGELVTVQFLLLWFALGAFAAAVTAIFYPFVYQLLVFVLISVIFTISSRKLVLWKNGTRTNVDALIGKEALVIETVQRVYCDRGLVKIHGEAWRAYCEDGEISVGTTVKIVEVNGTKLKVKS